MLRTDIGVTKNTKNTKNTKTKIRWAGDTDGEADPADRQTAADYDEDGYQRRDLFRQRHNLHHYPNRNGDGQGWVRSFRQEGERAHQKHRWHHQRPNRRWYRTFVTPYAQGCDLSWTYSKVIVHDRSQP